MSVDDLLKTAQQGGLKSLVLTDINTTSACLEFIRKAPQYGIKPIVGVDFREGDQQRFIAIAKNNDGFQEINHFLSDCLQHKKEIPVQAPAFEHAFIIYPYQATNLSILFQWN